MTNNELSEQQLPAVFQLPTGSYSTRAMLAFAGGSPFEVREFAAIAALVRHRSGDILIDAGFGRDAAAHIGMLPRFRQSAHRTATPVVDQMLAAGYDPQRLSAILLTHSHWDHVSGIADLEVPILITAEEIEYAERATGDRVFAAVAAGRALRRYGFDGGPFLGFERSHDIHGDGTIVVVPAGGHTSGSVIVFVTLPSRRYAFIGDLTWQLDGVERGVQRPWLMRRLADSDTAQVRADLARIRALGDEVQVVPAHDARAFQGIPVLGER